MYNLILNSIQWGKVFTVIAIVAVLAIIFTILILVVSKFCKVEENEKVTKIVENLAGANCGGCGYAGCEGFAKALAEGKADISCCGPTPNENKAKIAEVLGVPFSAGEKVYAVVKCSGGLNAKDKYNYVGIKTCASQNMYLGGQKICPNACLGIGTCETVCPYGAIKVTDGISLVDKALCEACGLCVKNCPKHVIEFIPKSAKVYVACSTVCKGKDTMNACKIGCISCGLCVKNCPQNAVTLVNNVPTIDYKLCNGCKTCVAKCPRKCIKEI